MTYLKKNCNKILAACLTIGIGITIITTIVSNDEGSLPSKILTKAKNLIYSLQNNNESNKVDQKNGIENHEEKNIMCVHKNQKPFLMKS